MMGPMTMSMSHMLWDRRQETHQQQREAEGRQEQQQEMKEEEHAVPTTVEEVKVYQEKNWRQGRR